MGRDRGGRFGHARRGWAVVALAAFASAGAGAAVPWNPAMPARVDAWSLHMNDAVVRAEGAGLRVEIAPGRTWAIAAVPEALLPRSIRSVCVRVAAASPGARWLVRVHGDLRGQGRRVDASPMDGQRGAGDRSIGIDARMIDPPAGAPVQVQVGLEGAPGDYAVFDRLEFVAGAAAPPARHTAGQRAIRAVDLMPDLPRPLRILDWRRRARDYDAFVFNANLRGEYLPLLWLDETRTNRGIMTFGLPSYVGTPQQSSGRSHEGVTCIGAVLGAMLCGVDKERQDHDYVAMCEAYYHDRAGRPLVLNAVDQTDNGSFWYDLFPNMAFVALADRCRPSAARDDIVRTTAGSWADAVDAMAGADGRPDFNHTAFSFRSMRPVDNGAWREPDAAAGIGWIEYMAWRRFRDPRFLSAADRCMAYLAGQRTNPFYEVLLPYGTLVAARMNAELGRGYDVPKMLDWCFGISDCRGGWAITTGNWGGLDAAGLAGSVDNRGGYAFAMNTFAVAGALAPLPRYDARYAAAIGKWLLNAANSARLFYPGEVPADHQSNPEWKGDPGGVIAYEGLRADVGGKGPFATGDPIEMKWGPKTNLGLYGSSYVGMLGAIVGRTSDPAILRIDCLATDFYHDRAYPTSLVYNPYRSARRVSIDVGAAPRDLYDAATHRFLARHVRGSVRVTVPAKAALVLVSAPSRGRVERFGRTIRVNGVAIDYAAPKPDGAQRKRG